MRIFFMGTPDFAASSLSGLLDGGYEVVGVFTQPDKPVGRRRVMEKPPVKRVAEAANIPVWQPKKLRDGTALDIIRSCAPDVIAVVAYGRILPKEILDFPRLGCVNIHGSLLPKYRGAAPIQWAVLNGERETGVTSMYMAEALDSGDIIDVRRVEILPGETSGELFERLAPIGAELLRDTLDAIEKGEAKRTPQREEDATYAPPLSKDDAAIDWSWPGRKIVSWVCGMDPWPVAYSEINGTVFKIYKASFREGKAIEAGKVVAAGKDGLSVGCSDGVVTVTELQAQGGKRMAAADYLRGHPICP